VMAIGDVPHAEQEAPTPRAAGPIARVAAEAAGAAALEEMAETLRHARESGRLVLDLAHDAIAPDHLVRDRLPAEDADMEALRESIRAHGQRTPVEVTPLKGALPYGLISGWRRLAALRALYAETGDPRFATVQALVRRPETAAAAYVAMVEENEIRLGLSQYERARVAAIAAEQGIFPTEDEALRALFSTASRAKRSRIRSFLALYHALDGVLRWPGHLPERLGLKLAELVRAGGDARIAAALRGADPDTPEAELAVLAAMTAPPRRAAPSSAAEECLRPGVTLSRTLRGRTLVLRLTGEGVTPELDAEIHVALRALAPG
jgi:ParB family transcriptional regulator, chromosome partitioning protein